MISLDVNGKKYAVEVSPEVPLLWLIREQLGLPGTKYGCKRIRSLPIRTEELEKA